MFHKNNPSARGMPSQLTSLEKLKCSCKVSNSTWICWGCLGAMQLTNRSRICSHTGMSWHPSCWRIVFVGHVEYTLDSCSYSCCTTNAKLYHLLSIQHKVLQFVLLQTQSITVCSTTKLLSVLHTVCYPFDTKYLKNNWPQKRWRNLPIMNFKYFM